jgi:hypothetical protein
MSRLIRLYPRAWRDRYEDEFLALLEERPPKIGDTVDIVRGALDAHLQPRMNGAEPTPCGAPTFMDQPTASLEPVPEVQTA